MDGSTATIIIGFVVSTIGFSVFLYGKKQTRPPQLVAGVLLMVAPFAVPGALWLAACSVLLVAGLVVAVRAGL